MGRVYSEPFGVRLRGGWHGCEATPSIVVTPEANIGTAPSMSTGNGSVGVVAVVATSAAMSSAVRDRTSLGR